MSSSRSIRIFLSSTFRDFGEERDLLVRRVFPALRAKLRERFVELVDVDLRWGITVQQAERGEVLPICLSEIDRARPYFIGMLGERYGWIPPPEGYAPDLVERQPWLKKHQGGKSVTELEILHGVLNNRRMKGRAFFYFRAPGYAQTKGGDYVPATPEDRQRQTDLKRRIRASAYPVIGYRDPQALARRLERDLWALLDAEFPASSVPDAFEREAMRHEAYAAPRRRLYLGGERYQAKLAQALESGQARVLVEGASGGGKSALLANFLEGWRKRHPRHLVHAHYLGASADAAQPHALVRRLIEAIARATHSTETIPTDPQALMESLPQWLGIASAWARKRRTRVVIALDALNSLSEQQDLRWWPDFLPPAVTVVVSCLPGAVLQALQARAGSAWTRITVKPLSASERRTLLTTYLARYNKVLPRALAAQALSHPLAGNPLFLRTLAEELRLFGVHEQLTERLAHYLESQTVDDLFERVLARVEGDCGSRAVREAMTAVWASRAGLSEKEILDIARLKPADWAPIRHALDESLLEVNGRITFAHDYMRVAVRDRYLPDTARASRAHRTLARWFAQQPPQARRAEEEPWQWRAAEAWPQLLKCLGDADLFDALEAHRPHAELLAYWNDLKAARGIDLADRGSRLVQAWHRADASASRTRLLARWAKFLTYSSNYGASERAFAITLQRAKTGRFERSWHEEVLTKQAWLYNGISRYDEALAIHHKLLAERTRRLGRAHRLTGETLQFIGATYYEQGRYLQAMELAPTVIEIFRATLGPGHVQTLNAINNLANLHIELGQFQQAVDMHREVLRLRKSTSGASGPEYAQTLNNLGRALNDAGHIHEAERFYRESIEAYQEVLGPNSADLLKPLSNLGLLLTNFTGSPEGLDLQRRALAIAERLLPPDHPEIARILINLSLAEPDAAQKKSLVVRAVSICRTRLGPHRFTVASLNHLAAVHEQDEDEASARACLQESVAMALAVAGERSRLHADCLWSLGDFLYRQDENEDARVVLEQALDIQEEVLSPDDPIRTRTLRSLAWTAGDLDDHARAHALLTRALKLTTQIHGPEYPHLIGILRELADEALALERPEEAVDLLRQSLQIAQAQAQAEADPTQTGEILWDLSAALSTAGLHAQAIPISQQELEIAIQLHGAMDTGVARSYWRLGNLYREAGTPDRGREYLQTAYDILLAQSGPDTTDLAWLEVTRGRLELAAGAAGAALTHLETAVRIFSAASPPDTDGVATAEELVQQARAALR